MYNVFTLYYSEPIDFRYLVLQYFLPTHVNTVQYIICKQNTMILRFVPFYQKKSGTLWGLEIRQRWCPVDKYCDGHLATCLDHYNHIDDHFILKNRPTTHRLWINRMSFHLNNWSFPKKPFGIQLLLTMIWATSHAARKLKGLLATGKSSIVTI